MYRSSVLVIGLLCSSAYALDYPNPVDPVAKSLVAQYIQDKKANNFQTMITAPNPIPAWPCEVSEEQQYGLAGLSAADPKKAAESEKSQRQSFRELGMSPQMIPKTSYSNIQIIPLKAQCTNGKLAGELQLLVTYDYRVETHSTIASGTGVVNGSTVINTRTISRKYMDFTPGLTPTTKVVNLTQSTVQTDTHYDDAQMEAFQKKTNQQLGLSDPTTIQIVSYSGPDGLTAQFSESSEKKASTGFFGVNITKVPSLDTTLTLPVDAHHQRTEAYKNDQLVSVMNMKDHKLHGESVTYMANYLKKLNMRLDQQPGMENARAVTINGVDLIETRICSQNGIAVKMSPCPAE
jgi:hypothetical protein